MLTLPLIRTLPQEVKEENLIMIPLLTLKLGWLPPNMTYLHKKQQVSKVQELQVFPSILLLNQDRALTKI